MIEFIDSLLDIPRLTLFWVFSGSLALLLLTVAISGRWNAPPKKPLDAVLAMLTVSSGAFWTGVGEGWRGYFAPLRWSPWRAAWPALGQPYRTWHSHFCAWFAEVERITWRR